MALTTYSGLLSAIPAWLMNRTDLADQVPDFIALAEDRISRELRISDMETEASASLVDGEAALPDDFLEMILVNMDNIDGPLSQLTTDAAADMYAVPTGGLPQHYSIVGNTLRVHGAGDEDVFITYYARPPALGLGVFETNWLLTKSPRLYLYGALCEAAPYLVDDARVQTWDALYNSALRGLRQSDELRGGSNLVSRVQMAEMP